MKALSSICPLCNKNNDKVLWSDKNCKAIEVIDENFGLHRIIWDKHVKEISELTTREMLELMRNVLKLEKFVKSKYNPDKVNIASLGNRTPHIHIHVCPRWKTDPWWPNTIWSQMNKSIWKKLDEKSGLYFVSGCWHDLNQIAVPVREDVFMKEQSINASDEWDDLDEICQHVGLTRNFPIGTGRLCPDGRIGRLSVIKTHRRKGHVRTLLNGLEKIAIALSFRQVYVHSQRNALLFYKNAGYVEEGNEFSECKTPHQKMIKTF